MASNAIDKEKKMAHPVEQNKTVIIEHDQQDDGQKTKSNSTANVSSQKQLLGLARKFSLDAALLPENKQAPLEDRSYRRNKLNELRQQQNMEAIVLRALQYCSNSTVTDRADQDWFSSFVALAQDISNKIMQDLWAKMLAGEISHSGSFSLKTLQAFRSMSMNEATLLAKACSLAVTDTRKKNIRVISGAYQTPKLLNFFNRQRQQRIDLTQAGLSYADILTLADNHLLFEQETESHALAKGEKIQFNYNGKPLSFMANKADCILTFYKFTPIGTELAHLVTNNLDNDYLTALKTQLTENFTVEG